MKISIVFIALILAIFGVYSQKSPQDSQDIIKRIAELGSNDLEIRTIAESELIKKGEPAIPFLEESISDADESVKSRLLHTKEIIEEYVSWTKLKKLLASPWPLFAFTKTEMSVAEILTEITKQTKIQFGSFQMSDQRKVKLTQGQHSLSSILDQICRQLTLEEGNKTGLLDFDVGENNDIRFYGRDKTLEHKGMIQSTCIQGVRFSFTPQPRKRMKYDINTFAIILFLSKDNEQSTDVLLDVCFDPGTNLPKSVVLESVECRDASGNLYKGKFIIPAVINFRKCACKQHSWHQGYRRFEFSMNPQDMVDMETVIAMYFDHDGKTTKWTGKLKLDIRK